MNTHTKRPHEKVARTSISLPPKIFEFANNRVRECGYASLSGYLQALVRQDANLVPVGQN